MKFSRPYHQKIITVLNALNENLFTRSGAYFGGGALLALQNGEFHWSKDIDFVCPSGPGCRLMRQEIFAHDYAVIFRDVNSIELPRPIKKDQYSIIFVVQIEDQLIKFEIFSEARIKLGEPKQPDWSPVPCLNLVDCFAEKLLANADRWLDSAVESRDFIDLSVLCFHESLPKESLDKAEAAYPVIQPLKDAINNFQ